MKKERQLSVECVGGDVSPDDLVSKLRSAVDDHMRLARKADEHERDAKKSARRMQVHARALRAQAKAAEKLARQIQSHPYNPASWLPLSRIYEKTLDSKPQVGFARLLDLVRLRRWTSGGDTARGA